MRRRTRINAFGDYFLQFDLKELEELYLYEGYSKEEASQRAKEFLDEYRKLNNQTKNTWRRARHR